MQDGVRYGQVWEWVSQRYDIVILGFSYCYLGSPTQQAG